jgi:hypothetical protein
VLPASIRKLQDLGCFRFVSLQIRFAISLGAEP